MHTLNSLSLLVLLFLLSWQCCCNAGEIMGFSEQPVEEFDSGSNNNNNNSNSKRRVLWEFPQNKRYISYAALRADVVPCERAGVPYYNCRSLPRANPYTRGCEIITLCARDSSSP